eukprot:scaffold33332_cov31-Tisochrysis_lutea.AAC.5
MASSLARQQKCRVRSIGPARTHIFLIYPRVRTRSLAMTLAESICPSFAAFLISIISFFSCRSSPMRSRSISRTDLCRRAEARVAERAGNPLTSLNAAGRCKVSMRNGIERVGEEERPSERKNRAESKLRPTATGEREGMMDDGGDGGGHERVGWEGGKVHV